MSTEFKRMRQLIGSEADWEMNDLIVGDGELAIVSRGLNGGRMKVGDGTRRFSELPYLMLGLNDAEVDLGDALILVQQPFAGAVPRTQHDKNADFVSVLDLGLVADGVSSNDAPLAVAETEAADKGFHLHWPRGSYRFNDVINKKPGVLWRGTGRTKAYPGAFVPSDDSLSTIVPMHNGRCAVRIEGSTLDGLSGMVWEDMNFATTGTAGSAGPTACFGFVCGDGAFQRDFTLHRIGIHGFTSAIDTYKVGAGANIEMGVIKVINCAISLNNWIARTLDGTQWNGFTFLYNEAGQNGYEVGGGGIDIGAFTAGIEHNLLEGQRDPVRLRGQYRGLSVRGNYFEANVGRACIELKDVRGAWYVGENNYSGINNATLDHQVILGTACGPGVCNDPYFPELVYKTSPAVVGADAGTGDNTLNPRPNLYFGRVDSMLGQTFAMAPNAVGGILLTQRANPVGAREKNPQTSGAMPVQQYTTAGVGAVVLNYPVVAAVGQWIVVSWLLKLVPDAGATPDPYVSLNINGAAGAGSRDFPMSRFGTYFRPGEWALITVATKALVATTSLLMNLYPHGVSPAAGRVSRFPRPTAYVVDVPDKIIPFLDNLVVESSAAAPTAGTWETGDFIRAAAPAAGLLGFACSAGGTPGTWVNV